MDKSIILFILVCAFTISQNSTADTLVMDQMIDFGTINAASGICSIDKFGRLTGLCDGQGMIGRVIFS